MHCSAILHKTLPFLPSIFTFRTIFLLKFQQLHTKIRQISSNPLIIAMLAPFKGAYFFTYLQTEK